MMKRITSVFVLLLIINWGFTQTNTVKGISIAEDSLPPHPSAILDVRSINKGVKFPVLSLEQRDALLGIATSKGVTLPEGLLVYVNRIETPKDGLFEKDIRGFWFWSTTPSPAWYQIKVESMSYPMGSVIMYNGSLSSFNSDGLGSGDYEGWALCNGNHGTPDLSGLFIKGGGASGDNVGDKGGDNSVVLTEQNLVTHGHGVDPIKVNSIKVGRHTHRIEDNGHSHPYQVSRNRKRASVDSDLLYGRRARRSRRRRRRRRRQPDKIDAPTTLVGIDADSTSNIDQGSEKLNISESVQSVGSGVPLDTRPTYYTVAYLMRTDVQDPQVLRDETLDYNIPDFTSVNQIENNTVSDGDNGEPLRGNREGVLITDNSQVEFPHPSSILDVNSITKGMLFPRMTDSEKNDIQPLANGLIVYVNSPSDKIGFWVWSQEESSWLRVQTALSTDNEIKLPNGGIIMYTGDNVDKKFDISGKGIPGTETEGWMICNGYNNTPDLRERFIVGYDATGTKTQYALHMTGGKSKHQMDLEHLPAHTHKINPVTVGVTHAHTIKTRHEKEHSIRSTKHGRTNRRSGYYKRTRSLRNTTTKTTTRARTGVGLVDADAGTVKVTVDPDFLKETGGGDPGIAFENQPRYYKVIYIIKNPLGENYSNN